MRYILTILLLFVYPAWATDYYVATDGSGSTCSAVSPCALSYANTNASAGDTVYLLTGTYDNDGYINPDNSGTSENRITFINSGGAVTISSQSYAVYLDVDYVTVQGIDGSSNTDMLHINGGSYNIIDDCEFIRSGTGWDENSQIRGGAQYNWIKNSVFAKGGACTGNDIGSTFDLGVETSDDNTSYNLIEDSTFYGGGHWCFGILSDRNTIRNNYFHNEDWDGNQGNRSLYMVGTDGSTINNLIESNRVGYTDEPCDDTQVSQFTFATESNIVRYNEFYHGNSNAMALTSYSGYADASDNRIYNNTFFNNGDELFEGGDIDFDAAIVFLTSRVINNVLKNNLYYSHRQVYSSESGGSTGSQTYANNYDGDTSGDPQFSNPTGHNSDETDASIPDLSLQSSSPARNAGGALTTVSSGCDTATLTLADASYFQDGSWGPSYASISADQLAVGTVSNTAAISSISGNSITFTASVSCTNGANVWLHTISDGTQVLYGSAPDAGANEYDTIPTIQGITINNVTVSQDYQ